MPTGKAEDIPLIAGKNVADVRYGHFVPDAQFAYGLKPHDPPHGELSYHLEQMLPVEAKSQLMSFTHHLGHSGLAGAIHRVSLHSARNNAAVGGGDAGAIGSAYQSAFLQRQDGEAVSRRYARMFLLRRSTP